MEQDKGDERRGDRSLQDRIRHCVRWLKRLFVLETVVVIAIAAEIAVFIGRK